MSAKIITAAFCGIEGKLITVEVDLVRALPCFNIVGLADTSVKESKERVRSAILNSGFEFPICRIVVNLAPADLKKAGTQFDLPIAIGILAASGQLVFKDFQKYLLVGELSLSGGLNRIPGALPITMEGMKNSVNSFMVPEHNALECSFVKGANIFAFNSLLQVAGFIKQRNSLPYMRSENNFEDTAEIMDYNEIIGQESAKRAIEVASAGGHNLILAGPPGSGKTMLAERIPSILPPLTYEESLNVTKIYSVSGRIGSFQGLIRKRPFRAPHHTATAVALVGGGNNLMPGEISLAHHGVLFLDEMLEFKRSILDILRQPLEERKISISRSSGTVTYPADIMLVGAMNPCHCGFYGSNRECTCSDYERRCYLSRLSSPLTDRIDMFAYVNSVPYNDIRCNKKGEGSQEIRARVSAARMIQGKRFTGFGISLNSQMSPYLIKKFCRPDSKSVDLLGKIYERYEMSARSYSRILKVSRTIADLNRRENIVISDIIEALQYKKYIYEK
ncbi:MAG: YifB family Mg chelatase-like AAA ATPase [Clostridiaceae bacterium]